MLYTKQTHYSLQQKTVQKQQNSQHKLWRSSWHQNSSTQQDTSGQQIFFQLYQQHSPTVNHSMQSSTH